MFGRFVTSCIQRATRARRCRLKYLAESVALGLGWTAKDGQFEEALADASIFAQSERMVEEVACGLLRNRECSALAAPRPD